MSWIKREERVLTLYGADFTLEVLCWEEAYWVGVKLWSGRANRKWIIKEKFHFEKNAGPIDDAVIRACAVYETKKRLQKRIEEYQYLLDEFTRENDAPVY